MNTTKFTFISTKKKMLEFKFHKNTLLKSMKVYYIYLKLKEKKKTVKGSQDIYIYINCFEFHLYSIEKVI